MAISKQEIKAVADLARLELSEQDLDKYTSELDKILTYIQSLEKVDTKGVEPLVHADDSKDGGAQTPTRSDIEYSEQASGEWINEFREDFPKIAPQTEGRFFKVPQMGK
ncbi:MAG: Asp-tRNA(Asn)/Glu-tRNA(Gln) amidotransferase subunit GatC [Candidatus Caenarcaniphilales bacterium]|nr:Asp-tRNA(Asn)/Glu-tRNA(Gln) amidotransferase subunit GatC [Candidatus Caenarcaniphilales bacterium]